eukprot:3318281-Pyramimonas_sp.AAC.2
MAAHIGGAGERHVQMREGDDERQFTSVSSVAASPSIPRRAIWKQEESMIIDSGASRSCSSLPYRVMRRAARAREG